MGESGIFESDSRQFSRVRVQDLNFFESECHIFLNPIPSPNFQNFLDSSKSCESESRICKFSSPSAGFENFQVPSRTRLSSPFFPSPSPLILGRVRVRTRPSLIPIPKNNTSDTEYQYLGSEHTDSDTMVSHAIPILHSSSR